MAQEAKTVDYGPLSGLIGRWEGDKGMDVAPEPDGSEESPYYETILFEPIGTVTNAERQTLAAVRYHQVVRRKSDDEVFHNETGYWCWDAANRSVMVSFAIPRAVCVIAGGQVAGRSGPDEATVIEVAAHADEGDWRVIQSPFMNANARTIEFRRRLSYRENSLSYSQTTIVDIYGKRFEHTDENELRRVATAAGV